MAHGAPFNYQKLKEKADYLEQYAKEKEISLSEVLNTPDKQLNPTPIIHHVFDSFRAAPSKEEKQQLLALAQSLFEKKADPNVKDSQGSPLLHRAIQHKSVLFFHLLANNQRVNYRSISGNNKTAKEMASEHWPKNCGIIALLNKHLSHNPEDMLLRAIDDLPDDDPAAEKGEKKPNDDSAEKAIAFLFDNRWIDVNKPNEEGLLLLHFLVVVGDAGKINKVLGFINQAKLAVDFKKQDGNGNTALHLACHRLNQPSSRIARWLINRDTPVNLKNQRDDTPLHLAVETNDPALVKCLLDGKADPSHQDAFGKTPLMRLLTRPELTVNVQIVQLLGQHSNCLSLSLGEPIKLAYERGFWIRKVAAYAKTNRVATEREIKILDAREQLSDDQLTIHDGGKCWNIPNDSPYMYSPATFVKAGIPVCLFHSSTSFGVIIQTDRPIAAWASGLNGQLLTHNGADVNFTADDLFIKYSEDHRCQNKTSPEIALQLQRLYEADRRSDSALERYEHLVCSGSISWNEGLFRYKKSEIIGFLVNFSREGSEEEDYEQAEMAFCILQLRSDLRLNHVPFCEYQSQGNITVLPDQTVQKMAAKYDPQKPYRPTFGYKLFDEDDSKPESPNPSPSKQSADLASRNQLNNQSASLDRTKDTNTKSGEVTNTSGKNNTSTKDPLPTEQLRRMQITQSAAARPASAAKASTRDTGSASAAVGAAIRVAEKDRNKQQQAGSSSAVAAAAAAAAASNSSDNASLPLRRMQITQPAAARPASAAKASTRDAVSVSAAVGAAKRVAEKDRKKQRFSAEQLQHVPTQLAAFTTSLKADIKSKRQQAGSSSAVAAAAAAANSSDNTSTLASVPRKTTSARPPQPF